MVLKTLTHTDASKYFFYFLHFLFGKRNKKNYFFSKLCNQKYMYKIKLGIN